MNILFKSLRMKNFLSIGDQWTSVKLDKNDFTVIVGKNGSGKSTMIDAICYVLFNKAFRKIKLGQLINTFNNKNSLVEIMFSAGGSDYVVRRGQKPKVFEIYKDKELVEIDPSVSDYQDHLENNILHVNYQTFTQINILGKATWKPFMQLETKDRRAVVEEILDSHIYSVMSTLAKEKIKDIKLDITTAQNEVRISENAVNTANALIKEYEKNQTASLEPIKKKILATKEEITSKSVELETDKAALVVLREDYANTKIPTVEKLSEAKQALLMEFNTINGDRNRADKTIRDIQWIETCPTCLQVMNKDHKNAVVSENKKISEDAVTKLISITNKQDKVAKILDEHTGLLSTIGDKEREVKAMESELSFLNRTLTGDIGSLKDASEISKKSKPDVGLEDKQKALTEFTAEYDKLNADITLYTSVLKKYLGDDGLKSVLISKYIPNINKMMNEYLEAMDLFAQFELNEEFEETIRSHYRDTFSYNSFSEGQKQRIDLSILLTWRNIAMSRNSTSSNLLIMDEILDSSMDGDGTTDFLNILKTLGLAQNVFIISHNAATIDNFEHSIKVNMDGNFTVYETNE